MLMSVHCRFHKYSLKVDLNSSLSATSGYWIATEQHSVFIFAFSSICHLSSHLVSGHFKEMYLSYVYQIGYGCLLV